MIVKTRFAPSPTGLLHVGGVRTALFSWLFARHHQGKFLLRIEDTDRTRSNQESIAAILEGMSWIGLDYDEGPIYQTDRYDRYKAASKQLLEEGKAYRCCCSVSRLDELRVLQLAMKEKPRYDNHCREKNIDPKIPHVIRFKNPQTGVVSFVDEVYGSIHVNNSELDDLVLLRQDGNPTYNFAVVIDDWDMEITHVIRGDDHINNTPRQINIYRALNASVPIFAHLPMILGGDGKRLSKRHGAVSVLEFKEQGVLPEALLNYLVRLGWAHNDQEIFSITQMIDLFSLKNVSRGVASFNYDKLFWLNQHYQKTSPVEEVASALSWHFLKCGIDLSKGPDLIDLVTIQGMRCKTLAEICEKSRYFYEDNLEFNEADVKKHFNLSILQPLEALYASLSKLDPWEVTLLNQCINDVAALFNINMGKIAQPLRVALTGGSMSPSIDITLHLLGKERSLIRLNNALEMIRKEPVN